MESRLSRRDDADDDAMAAMAATADPSTLIVDASLLPLTWLPLTWLPLTWLPLTWLPLTWLPLTWLIAEDVAAALDE